MMTNQQEKEQASSGSKLLTMQEQTSCKQIAISEAPNSQRAMALLALNAGSTQAQAAEQTGLTIGQVKYWVGKFRKQRLNIFPNILLGELDAEDEEEKVTEIEKEPESVIDERGSKKKEKKTRKGKKTKKAKKDRKSKKSKKSKKKNEKTKKEKKSKKNKKSKKAKKD